ncbi:hypothetical protein [Streptomyces xanthochromogenes]|uniref:hypothetical protein n=1 Tax=Streptomyces xanthochromogenes TaxID=67384 RepID=UPI003426BA4A
MASIYNLYGIKELPIEESVRHVKAKIGGAFSEHESSYKGVYFRAVIEDCEVTIEHNSTDDEGYRAEPNHTEYEILVYLNEASELIVEELADCEEITLLRSELI